jgi:integrase
VLAYNTGLRLSDLVQLTWHDCDLNRRVIKTQASKTGKLHHLPINDLLFSHLDALPRHHRRVLAITDGAASYVGKKLHELCALAGCEPITAQMIRRRAACEFERVHPGAGALLLGHTLSGPTRVTWSHYIDPLDVVLRPASQKIPQPWG